jgi:hypothetical protein
MTAKRREAIAAPEMSARAIMRNREAIFATVAGDRSEEVEGASGIVLSNGSRSVERVYKLCS